MSRLFFRAAGMLFHYFCVLDVALAVIATCCRHDQHQNEIKQQARETGGEDRQSCINHTDQGGVNLKILGDSAAYSCQNLVGRAFQFLFCHSLRAMAQNDSRLCRSYDLLPCSRSSVRTHFVSIRPEGRALQARWEVLIGLKSYYIYYKNCTKARAVMASTTGTARTATQGSERCTI